MGTQNWLACVDPVSACQTSVPPFLQVADFHRTLIYGGWAANPRSHLRLVYEANPLSFLVEAAGGKVAAERC